MPIGNSAALERSAVLFLTELLHAQDLKDVPEHPSSRGALCGRYTEENMFSRHWMDCKKDSASDPVLSGPHQQQQHENTSAGSVSRDRKPVPEEKSQLPSGVFSLHIRNSNSPLTSENASDADVLLEKAFLRLIDGDVDELHPHLVDFEDEIAATVYGNIDAVKRAARGGTLRSTGFPFKSQYENHFDEAPELEMSGDDEQPEESKEEYSSSESEAEETARQRKRTAKHGTWKERSFLRSIRRQRPCKTRMKLLEVGQMWLRKGDWADQTPANSWMSETTLGIGDLGIAEGKQRMRYRMLARSRSNHLPQRQLVDNPSGDDESGSSSDSEAGYDSTKGVNLRKGKAEGKINDLFQLAATSRHASSLRSVVHRGAACGDKEDFMHLHCDAACGGGTGFVTRRGNPDSDEACSSDNFSDSIYNSSELDQDNACDIAVVRGRHGRSNAHKNRRNKQKNDLRQIVSRRAAGKNKNQAAESGAGPTNAEPEDERPQRARYACVTSCNKELLGAMRKAGRLALDEFEDPDDDGNKKLDEVDVVERLFPAGTAESEAFLDPHDPNVFNRIQLFLELDRRDLVESSLLGDEQDQQEPAPSNSNSTAEKAGTSTASDRPLLGQIPRRQHSTSSASSSHPCDPSALAAMCNYPRRSSLFHADQDTVLAGVNQVHPNQGWRFLRSPLVLLCRDICDEWDYPGVFDNVMEVEIAKLRIFAFLLDKVPHLLPVLYTTFPVLFLNLSNLFVRKGNKLRVDGPLCLQLRETACGLLLRMMQLCKCHPSTSAFFGGDGNYLLNFRQDAESVAQRVLVFFTAEVSRGGAFGRSAALISDMATLIAYYLRPVARGVETLGPRFQQLLPPLLLLLRDTFGLPHEPLFWTVPGGPEEERWEWELLDEQGIIEEEDERRLAEELAADVERERLRAEGLLPAEDEEEVGPPDNMHADEQDEESNIRPMSLEESRSASAADQSPQGGAKHEAKDSEEPGDEDDDDDDEDSEDDEEEEEEDENALLAHPGVFSGPRWVFPFTRLIYFILKPKQAGRPLTRHQSDPKK
ncbi:unnamed protein product [Amoebophrya sp. A25]|nr:unnamed protein product [Amoebophrya sp. A25]|eukprot:GSA25T00018816001.1